MFKMTQRIVNAALYNKTVLRLMSTEAVAKPKRPVALRTSADPLSHEEKHLGHFYTIPEETLNSFFALGGLPNSYRANIKTFGEASIMVRSPAVELISYLKKTNYENPAIRYVFYGKRGNGKSLTLSHALHYAYLANFIVVHIPWVWNWYRRDRIEVAVSETKPGLYNLPVEAATWLKYFQKQNAHILSSPDLRLTKEYVWSPREKTPANAPLQELVTHGISRIRYACDVIDVLINELKLLSSQGRCKTLIAIDGFNHFFLPISLLKNPEKRRIIPDQVTLAQTFISAVNADWKNGAVVVTVDTLNANDRHSCEKPLHLLGKRGFELLDPFIPIEVPEFSEFEFNSMLDYYEDRRWLQRPGAREELDFISARNPYYLMTICAPL